MSVYKRNGRWHFTKTIDGVRHRGALKTARTKAQAEEAERKKIHEIHEGVFGKPFGTIAIKDFLDTHYVPWAKTNKRSWKSDVSRLKGILDFFGEKKQLRQISTFDVERFKIERRQSPVRHKYRSRPRSIAAVNREFRLLSGIFRLAIAFKLAATNPCQGVRVLKGECSRDRYLLPDEEARLWEVLEGSREHLKPMVSVLLYAGLREGELLGLKVVGVDLNRHRIAIRKTKTDEDRQVPISSALRPILVELVRHAEFRGQQYLFTNPVTKTRYGRIKTAWVTACKLAGISNLHIHDLRRTFGTRAADNGAPLTGLQRVMGHKRIETTMVYARGTEDGMERAVNAAQKSGHKSVTDFQERRAAKVVNGRK